MLCFSHFRFSRSVFRIFGERHRFLFVFLRNSHVRYARFKSRMSMVCYLKFAFSAIPRVRICDFRSINFAKNSLSKNRIFLSFYFIRRIYTLVPLHYLGSPRRSCDFQSTLVVVPPFRRMCVVIRMFESPTTLFLACSRKMRISVQVAHALLSRHAKNRACGLAPFPQTCELQCMTLARAGSDTDMRKTMLRATGTCEFT